MALVGSASVEIVPDARGFREKLDAAIKGIDAVKIAVEVATDEARAKIDELVRTRTLNIGVVVDTTEAATRLAELERARTVQFRVDLDDAIAKAKLDELARDRTATIRVNTVDSGSSGGGASSGGGGLLAAALPLAALAVPLGAATLGLGAGLAGGAVAAVGALGALKLGLSGVGTAVQAVQAQQASAGADATAYGNAQASAAAGVVSAQNGLANAQRSAATAATSSARAITTAQQGVADAQRAATASVTTALAAEVSARTAVVDATRTAAAGVATALTGQETAERTLETAQQSETTAQNALTAARKTAQQQIEDLTNSVADGVLAQRAAALNVEQANQNLAKVTYSGTSTQLQRDQARLAYDQALQQVTDLTTRQTRLVDQKAAADKAGVDGSTVVQNAQTAVAKAIDTTSIAQDNLARANAAVTEAQRKGAETVAKAQQALLVSTAAVTEARRAGAESVAKAEQGVTAAQEASAASAASSAASITSAQEGVANALRQQAVAAAAVSSSAATAATALAGLTPAAAIFAQFVVSTLEPALKRLKDAASSGFLPGLQQGITDLLPLMPVFTSIVSNVSTALGGLFTAAGAGLSGPFFTQFFGFLRDTAGPALSTLGTIIGNVVTGFAGLFQGFAPVIAQVGGGIAGLTGQFAAFATSLSTSNGFQSFLAYVVATGPLVASTFGDLFRLIGNLIEGLAPLGAVLLTVVDQVAKLLANLGPQGLLIAIAAVSAAVVGLGIAFGPISISVVAISAGLTALSAIFINLYQSSKPFHDAIQAIGSYFTGTLVPIFKDVGSRVLDTLKVALGYVTDKFNENKANLELFGGALVALGRLIIEKVVPFLLENGLTAAIKLVGIAIGALLDGIGLAVDGFKDLIRIGAEALTALSKVPYFGWAADASASLSGLSTSLDKVGTSASTTATSTTSAGNAAGYTKDKADALSTAQDGLKTSQDKLNTAIQTSVDKFTLLNGGVLAQQTATDALAAATDALSTSVKTNGTSLDGNTEKGRANKAAIEGALTALNDKITADFKANESTDGYSTALEKANAQAADGKAKLETLAGQLGLNKDQTDALVSSILKTPDQVKTEFSNNLTQAQADVAAFQATVDAIHGKDIKIGVQGYIQGGTGNEIIPGQGAIPKATGGYISGAGTGTSDSIPARLSNGEFVVKASETVKHLPMLHAMNNGQLPGFANGGFVPKAVVTLNGSDDFTPATSGIADFFKKLNPTNLLGLASVGSGGIGSSIPGAGGSVDRWAPQILQALALQGLPANFLAGVENVIAHESGGNPNAINLTDSNAVAGHPSQGLMQTIPSTFLGNAGPFASRGITDPLANIYAGIHYAMANYGAGFFANGGRSDSSGGYLGYDSGGYIPPGVSNIYNGTGKPEMVFTPEQLSKRDAQGGNGGAFTDQQVRQLVHAIGQVAPGVTDGLNGVARSAYAAQRG